MIFNTDSIFIVVVIGCVGFAIGRYVIPYFL